MPKFDTPEPISVALEISVGTVRLTASERTDTVVEVRPSDETEESDVRAAEQVRVDYANGTLQITGPKSRAFDFSRKTRSVDVSVELPSGSGVSAELQAGDIHGAGRFGDCRCRTSAGNIRLEHTGTLRLHASAGHLAAESVTGDADVSTGSGRVRLGEITGAARIKNSNGATTIDAITGDVRVRSANGDISVDRAGGSVDAKTSNGNIRLGEVVRGSVALATAMGDLEVGVAAGTAAWLAMDTGYGHVRNLLENAARPDDADETVEVHGSTSYGDVLVRRS